MRNADRFDSKQPWKLRTASETRCFLRGNRKHNTTDNELNQHTVSVRIIYFITSWILDFLSHSNIIYNLARFQASAPV
jgi:hypothetical protein